MRILTLRAVTSLFLLTSSIAFASSQFVDIGGGGIPPSEKGAPNGVATLDGAGLVPASQIPPVPGGVTNVTGTAPVASSGGTTPAISMPQATNLVDGYLFHSDWVTFNAKQNAFAGLTSQYVRGDGSLATLSTTVVPEGTNLYFTNARAQGAVSASAPLVDTVGVFSIPVATNSVDGYLSAADHTSFAAKQPAGAYITALTGDVSAAGPGSSAATLATVNANVGAFGDASHSLSLTANAKGLLTAVSTNSIQVAESQVTNLVSDLAAKQATLSNSSAPANQFGTGFTAPNTFNYAQPDFSNLSGSLDLSGAQASGILAAARFPALLDDVTTPSGSLHTTVSNSPDIVFVNFLDGNDGTGTGTDIRPWKTIQHACTAIAGSVSINRPYVIKISGGNNDSDAAPITCSPNISIYSDYPIQISQPYTITGGVSNDAGSFSNIIFIGAFTWIRNDVSVMGIQFNQTQFFSGPVLKQQGAGSLSVTMYNSVTVNMDLLAPKTGSFFFNHTFLGTTNFEDTDASAYFEAMGGYTDSAMAMHGGATYYFSGIQVDVPFGATLTGTTTANGTPAIQTDSGSVPPSIAGAFTISLISNANHENYSPSTPGNWTAPPVQVADALDKLAAKSQTAVPRSTATAAINTVMSATITSDSILNMDTSGGARLVTIPDATLSGGFCVDIKDLSTNSVTISAPGGQTIDGLASDSLTVQNESHHLCAVGGNWFNY